ncbi:MAG: hypothetical protein MJ252_09505 [archaeon]|nr:hypothetical protein [archaeon]
MSFLYSVVKNYWYNITPDTLTPNIIYETPKKKKDDSESTADSIHFKNSPESSPIPQSGTNAKLNESTEKEFIYFVEEMGSENKHNQRRKFTEQKHGQDKTYESFFGYDHGYTY